MKFMNVKERWYLYDTILVSPWISTLPSAVPGWYSTFATLGAADDLSFFTTRNKSIGLAYNNQESRDQIPFALIAETLSVDFFSPSVANHKGLRTVKENWFGEVLPPHPEWFPQPPEEAGGGGQEADDIVLHARIDTMSPFWSAELPQHASVVFRTNQDDRLRTNAAMLPPGSGPIGHVRGQGALNAPVPFPACAPWPSTAPPCSEAAQNPDLPVTGGESGSFDSTGQGRAHRKYRWTFEGGGIGIQKRATIEVQIRFSEWARQVLQSVWGPGQMKFWPFAASSDTEVPAAVPTYYYSAFGIQVCITGSREVQQRGQYHV